MAIPAVSLAESTLAAIRDIVPIGSGTVPLHEPQFNGREWEYVKECLDSGWVSSKGKFVERFEEDLAAFTGAKHAVAVVNGTAALHVALRLAGVQAGNEVLIPALSFVATANAVAYCGATPHFADCEELTLGLDPDALRDYLSSATEIRNGECWNRGTDRRIRALVPMHVFGHPVDLEGVMRVSRDFHLELVEDAAESLGSLYQGRHTGTFGRFGTLSFNGNKTITAGGGGALLTNDAELARQAKHLTTTARVPHPWEHVHDELGYNYRLPNLNAALGCAQLENLPQLVEAQRRLFERYREAFASIPQLRIVSEPAGCRSNYWLQGVLLNDSVSEARDSILTRTHDAGFMTRPVWRLLHRLKMYRDCPRMPLDVAESLERRIINLPSSARLA